MSVNRVILVGNLGKEPEVRSLETGVKVATFSLATSESYKDKNGQRVDQTEWHNIVMWRGLAEIAEKFLHKGSMIYVEGKLRTRTYDKEGQKHYTTEIVVDNMKMLGNKRDSAQNESVGAPAAASSSNDNFTVPTPEDDLPF